MKLTVDNFAFIKHADVTIDGITVIAGNNNTGKSTIGKILFATFNALNGLDEKIKKQRWASVSEALRYSCYDFYRDRGSILISTHRYIERILAESGDLEHLDWDAIFDELSDKYSITLESPFREKIIKEVGVVLSLSNEELLANSLLSNFMGVFNEQVNSLYNPETTATIALNIKKSPVSISITHNASVEYSSEIDIENKAFYYSTPTVIDNIGAIRCSDVLIRHLSRTISDYAYAVSDSENLFAHSLQKNKLENVLGKIEDVVSGSIVRDGKGYSLRIPRCKESLSLKNLSSGVKAFIVLKMLLEANFINRRDVLILDEPEIHLHPMWQLKYAELIVLLQKEFDLSVVITTHSNFFLNAIETYSRKYETSDKLKLYLAEVEEGGAVMKDVTDNTEPIYKKMAEAVATLRSERIELSE